MAMGIKGWNSQDKKYSNKAVTSSAVGDSEALDVNIVNGGTDGSDKVVKAVLTETDLDEGVIALEEEMSGFEIWNDNQDEGLEFTINGVTIPVEAKNVDSKGLPNKYHFSGCFTPFTEVEVTGTDLDFDVIISG